MALKFIRQHRVFQIFIFYFSFAEMRDACTHFLKSKKNLRFPVCSKKLKRLFQNKKEGQPQDVSKKFQNYGTIFRFEILFEASLQASKL